MCKYSNKCDQCEYKSMVRLVIIITLQCLAFLISAVMLKKVLSFLKEKVTILKVYISQWNLWKVDSLKIVI